MLNRSVKGVGTFGIRGCSEISSRLYWAMARTYGIGSTISFSGKAKAKVVWIYDQENTRLTYPSCCDLNRVTHMQVGLCINSRPASNRFVSKKRQGFVAGFFKRGPNPSLWILHQVDDSCTLVPKTNQNWYLT